jgi:hypothetical protein
MNESSVYISRLSDATKWGNGIEPEPRISFDDGPRAQVAPTIADEE